MPGDGSFAALRLRPATLAALAAIGIERPTPIQAAAIPALQAGRDVIAQARTGSGKTLAFGIPALEAVDVDRRAVQVLVLTPTRELAVQVGGVLEQVGGGRGVRVGLVYGGRAIGPQREMLQRGTHVVVGTPGRVLDLLGQGALRLDQVRVLVRDEADEMLDRGFAPDVERIIGRTPRSRQTALFSATIPTWVGEMAERHLTHPVTIAIDPRPEASSSIAHVAFDVQDGDKLAALRDLLDHRGEGSVIVFGRTKHGVKKLARRLEQAGYPVAALQGNLSQSARDRVMEDFRSGRVPILVATNVAARGIDVTSVDQVINVELPESPELLTHRIGRTGRMGRPGRAITLLAPEDGAKWRQLERGLGQRIPRATWAGAAAALGVGAGH
ncbi:MAG: DEAD/DEAH box helicase, partial [Thermomicrobiaceae bacterium]|nr:DEAD/DEAH box helicase [Thermomicrobiaceae bacterium]